MFLLPFDWDSVHWDRRCRLNCWIWTPSTYSLSDNYYFILVQRRLLNLSLLKSSPDRVQPLLEEVGEPGADHGSPHGLVVSVLPVLVMLCIRYIRISKLTYRVRISLVQHFFGRTETFWFCGILKALANNGSSINTVTRKISWLVVQDSGARCHLCLRPADPPGPRGWGRCWRWSARSASRCTHTRTPAT